MSGVTNTNSASKHNYSRKRVAIRRDDKDFVIAFQPGDVVVFRSGDVKALRKICWQLRWEVESDAIPEPNDPASW